MKNFSFATMMAACVALSGCQFSNKSNLLLPTAPSATTSATTSAASSAAASTTTAAASAAAAAAAGNWASPAIAGLPNLQSCTNLQWQISSLSPTAVAGSISTVCGGVVTVNADLTGQMTGSDVVNLTASGQAVGLGLTCPFTLTGVGHLQGSDAMQLDYQGSTCIGPVSGSELLQRRAPAAPEPPQAAPAPEQAPAPEAPPAEDDGAFGCSSIGDHGRLVECIHEHINPHNEVEAFEVTKRVAWALRGEGAGLLIKNSGENIVSWQGRSFAAGRICYADGHIIKVISDVGPGGSNGPSWQDNGFVDRNLYVAAIDPR